MCSRAAGLRLRLREAARLQLVRLVVICKYVVQFRLRPRPLSRVRVFNKKEMGLWNSIADGGKMSMLRGSDPRCVRSGRVVSDLNGYYDSQNIIAVPIKATQQSSPCPCLVPACDLQTPEFTGTVLSVVLHHSHNHEGGAGLRHVPPAPSTLAGSRCSEISVAGCTTNSATTWASHGQLLGP